MITVAYVVFCSDIICCLSFLRYLMLFFEKGITSHQQNHQLDHGPKQRPTENKKTTNVREIQLQI